jgi:hypothetical protein
MRWVAFGVQPVGVFAVGANATGIIAIGQLATGVIAVGQLARGVFVVGQLAVGVVAVGQLAFGVLSAGGMLGVARRRRFGLVWPVRPAWLVVVLAVSWWLVAGMWLWDAVSREGGIIRDAPAPLCADEPGRAC